MKVFIVKTGFGYFENTNGHVVAKSQLPPGEHTIKEGYIYYEVNNQVELDAIEVYQDPQKIEKAANEQKITAHIRTEAIAKLKASGGLQGDYK